MELNSNLHQGNYSCPRDEIIFTCTVNGSRALSWSSIEYIGPVGTHLEFADNSGINATKPSRINPGTFAILTNVVNGTGSNNQTILQLQSELHISEANLSSTVSCFSDTNTTRKNISFTVLGRPEHIVLLYATFILTKLIVLSKFSLTFSYINDHRYHVLNAVQSPYQSIKIILSYHALS